MYDLHMTFTFPFDKCAPFHKRPMALWNQLPQVTEITEAWISEMELRANRANPRVLFVKAAGINTHLESRDRNVMECHISDG